MVFILGEDKALRLQLQGVTVSDQKADGQEVARQVGVWFGQPDQELRAQNYPYITIDMIDVVRDTQREHRGIIDTPSYIATTIDNATESAVINYPIPVYIDYQVTTYARHPRHDREMLSQVLYEKLPIRFGTLEVIEGESVDGDTTTVTSTMRRLDVVNVSKRDSTEQAKRLFVNAITVRISSEMPLSVYKKLYKVTEVHHETATREGFESVSSSIITGA